MADSMYLLPGMNGYSDSVKLGNTSVASASSSLSPGAVGGRSAGGGGGAAGGGDGATRSLMVPAVVVAGAALAYTSIRYVIAKAHVGSQPTSTPDGAAVLPRRQQQQPQPLRRARSTTPQELAQAAAAGSPRPRPNLPRPRGSSGPSPPGASSPGPAPPLGNSAVPTVQSKWIRSRELGRGTYGIVYKGMNRNTGQVVAIKEMKELRFSAECKKEFDLLRGIRNPFVVAIYGLEEDPPARRGGKKRLSRTHRRSSDRLHRRSGDDDDDDDDEDDDDDDERDRGPGAGTTVTRLIMEMCPNGSLSDVLARHGTCGEKLLRCYARQMLLGLQALHDHNILHRDIKPANILVDANGRLKLTDFGMSRHIDTMATRTSLAGSPAYMSPEAVEGRYVVGTDLWSLGATLSHLATGIVPWTHIKDRDLRNPHALLHFICQGPTMATSRAQKIQQLEGAGHHPLIPPEASPECRAFFQQLFAYDPQKRGTCDSLLAHPFLVRTGPSPVTVDTCFEYLSSDDEDDATATVTTATLGGITTEGSSALVGVSPSTSRTGTTTKGSSSNPTTVNPDDEGHQDDIDVEEGQYSAAATGMEQTSPLEPHQPPGDAQQPGPVPPGAAADDDALDARDASLRVRSVSTNASSFAPIPQ